MDENKLISDIINHLKEIDNLKLMEIMRHYMAEYTQNRRYFNEYNLWALLLAKKVLENHYDKCEGQKKRNEEEIERLEILNNNKKLKENILSVNDTDSDIVRDIILIIK